jgi:predicted transcriptional regulator
MANFTNHADNNIFIQARNFANQKQFWADFSMIFNSTFLKQRRAGLTLDLNANEIANYVSNSKSPIKSALNYLLQKGFLPTQIADSFAIAMGGATFYRNRVNKYLVEGMTKKEAEEQAFLDMQDIAEETQQSARPDRISQQQASVLGRIILAFQNTPMQYTRLMKKAILDLKDGRGDVKTNISKIIYYGAIQNIIFYSLQTALFAMMFGDDDDEEFFDKKKERVLNGTLDSTLRGMGVGGAVVSTVKNMILKFLEEQDKPRYRKNENAVLLELLNLSPPIGIKARQIQMGTRTLNWNQDTIEEIPLYNLDNPIWEAGFNYTQALTNVPVARMHTKVTNLREAANKENEAWQRIAILMGWSKWNLGAKSKKTKKTGKKKRKQLILR